MIDGLIAGKLYGKAQRRTGASGKPFVTARVLAPTAGGDSTLVSVIAFDTAACNALLALEDSDAVALAGTITPKAWMDKNGGPKASLDMVAHAVLTAYHVARKRKAAEKAPARMGANRQACGS